MLQYLQTKNADKTIFDLSDAAFASYGRVLSGYDFSELTPYMTEKAVMPEQGNVYFASVEEMENTAIYETLKNNFYGGMDIQIGYCNGRNSTFNGFEYHKGSEINVALTDCMLFLGHTWDIENNTYPSSKAEIFFVRAGQAFEMYQTTMHLSPCKTSDQGFRAVVVLPRGTNTDLEHAVTVSEPENQLLLQKNKWVLAHPDRKPLIDRGAYPGILGENIELKY